MVETSQKINSENTLAYVAAVPNSVDCSTFQENTFELKLLHDNYIYRVSQNYNTLLPTRYHLKLLVLGSLVQYRNWDPRSLSKPYNAHIYVI